MIVPRVMPISEMIDDARFAGLYLEKCMHHQLSAEISVKLPLERVEPSECWDESTMMLRFWKPTRRPFQSANFKVRFQGKLFTIPVDV